MMELFDALNETFDHAHAVVAGVKPEQLVNATPCSEWNVEALLSHVFGVVGNIGDAVATGAPTGKPNEMALSDDLAGQFRSLADSTLAAWKTAGLDGETNIGAGPMPRQVAMSINLLDTATHSWDLARATGQPEELPAELATLLLGICQGFITDEIRSFAGFAPAVPVAADASATHQLVAFLGRQP
jgi:uncharacterized protein (TIGR03086 family)